MPEPLSFAVANRVVEPVVTAANSLLARLLGPAIDEIGGILGDRARVWRAERQLKLLTAADGMLRSANVTAQRVPLKVLAPILEGVVLEEDDDMISAWAALLANAAAAPLNARPVYGAILKEITGLDAFVLTHLVRTTEDPALTGVTAERDEFHVIWELESVFESDGILLAVDNLIRLNLLVRDTVGEEIVRGLDDDLMMMGGRAVLRITKLGHSFFRACSPFPRTPTDKGLDLHEIGMSIRDSLIILAEAADDAGPEERVLRHGGTVYELTLLRPQLQRGALGFSAWEPVFGPWRLQVRRHEGRETAEFEWPGLESGDLRALSEAECRDAVLHALRIHPHL